MDFLQKIISKIFNSRLILNNPYIKGFINTKSVEKIHGKYLNAAKNSSVDRMNISIRKPSSETKITVGENSIIQGNFVIESEKGKIKIGDRTFIGGGLFVCTKEIEIGSDIMFSWGCTVVDNNSHSTIWNERKNDVTDWKKGIDENKLGEYKDWSNVKESKVTIKDKAWIGFNSIILKGVTIGEGSIIASGSVVTKSIPDWTIAGGNPAKIIREIPENEQ